MKRIRMFVLCGFSVLLSSACGTKEINNPYTPGKYPTEIPTTTKISDSATSVALTSSNFETGTMIFAQSTALLV